MGHFMNYDRLQIDAEIEINKLAKFLGVPLHPHRCAEIANQASFQSMKASAAASEEAKGRGKGFVGRLVIGEPLPWSDILYNKGVRGAGKTRLSPDQARRIDKAYAQSMKEVGHLF